MNADDIEARPPRFANWLMTPIRQNRSVYIKVVVASVMINLFALAASIFSMTVYDRVIPNNAMASLVGLSVGMGIVLLFDFVLKILRSYFVDIAGADIDQQIGDSVFARLLTIRLDQKRGSTGGLASLMRELETLRDFFASATLTVLVDVPFIILTLIVIALIGGWLVLVPLLLIPVVIISGLMTQPTLDRLSAKMMGQTMHKQAVLVEAIGALEMVKAAGAGNMLKRRWYDAVFGQARSSLSQRSVANISMTVAGLGQQIAYAGVVIAGATMIGANALTTGGLLACSILAGRAVAPLTQIANLLSRLISARTAYRQLNALMNLPHENDAATGLAPNAINGGIEFRNVSFVYPDATEKALDSISFTINPGEKVALLGRVGSGKSTIQRLLAALYAPSEGQILIDGTEVRQINTEIYRRFVGCGMQDTVLLSGTVRDNILLDRPNVDDEEMLRVATLSGTHDFMGRIANGYDLILSDRGESLSGGQRQSISLARALAGRPQILLLDEPSSAMDSQTEQALIDRLATELSDRTLLLITHRVPLLRLVDRIILLDQGRIVANGPRDIMVKKLSVETAS
jgi:ATP-binding cassette, subfamily C, bacterial LapB